MLSTLALLLFFISTFNVNSETNQHFLDNELRPIHTGKPDKQSLA